ncbi:YceI family protein [Deinococcus malanensis]
MTEHNKHNAVTIELKTVAENFTGRTNTLSRSVIFDPQANTGSGTIAIKGTTIQTGITKRDEHMRSVDWLNFNANPDVKFVVTTVKHLQANLYQVNGNLTLNGVTKAITANATVRHTPANATTRALGAKGDVLGVIAKFKMKLSEFGVKNTTANGGRVNNDAALTVKFIASNK